MAKENRYSTMLPSAFVFEEVSSGISIGKKQIENRNQRKQQTRVNMESSIDGSTNF